MSIEITEDLSIAEFCELHNACKDGRDWALALSQIGRAHV